MKIKIIQPLLITVMFSATFANAQDWKAKFPQAEVVYSNLSCEVVIKNDKGRITASSTHNEDIFLASEKGARMMGSGSIYHSIFNELKDWKAYTISAANKKSKPSNINIESSRQDFIFYDDSKTTSFDFTDIAPGATRHIDYELFHSDAHLLMPFYFDQYFPVLNGELKVVFPPTVKLKYVIRGVHADKVNFSESVKRDKTTYTFTIKDQQGVPYYEDAPGNPYYATHVIFHIDQVEQDGKWSNFLSSVADLYKYNSGFIKGLNEQITPELKQLTDSVIAGARTESEKARRLYQWVQSNIKYVAFEEGMEGFVPRPASLVCTRRFGDCKDMSSILTTMLNYAGVKAWYTWIGTRNLPYTYSEIPLPLVDNHMITTAWVDGKYIFLDGTDDECIFGFPSPHIQGKEALIAINPDEYKVVKVEVTPKEKNTVRDSTFLEFTESGLAGKVRIHLTGYASSVFHGISNYKNEKEREEYFLSRFSRGNNKIKFTNWAYIQSPDRNHTLVTADLVLSDYARKVGDEWLMNMNLFKFYEHKEIELPKRKSPIEYKYLSNAQYTTVLQVPAGYSVTHVPKSEVFQNKVWGFKMEYKPGKNTISLEQQYDTNQLILEPQDFEQWNKVLEHLFPHYKQIVVISKN